MGKWSTYRRRGTPKLVAAPPVPQHLLDGLDFYFELNEVSGNRTDIHAATVFTPTTSLGSAAGVIGLATESSTTNEKLVQNPINGGWLGLDSSRTISLWVRPGFSGANRYAFNAAGGTTGDTWGVATTAAGEIQFWLRSTGSPYYIAETSGLGATSGQWYHILGEWDEPNHIVRVTVDNSNTGSAAGPPGPYSQVAALAWIGGYQVATNDWIGRVDELGWWSRLLTADEKTALYGGGAGLPYSSFLP